MTFPAERMRRLFFAGLGVVFVLAFASLGVQIAGLIGSHGILPAQELLAQWREQTTGTAYEHAFAHGLPTLFWFDASDGTLRAWCGVGIACGGLLALGLAPLWTTGACGLVYLSFVSAGDVFLGYQWDSLLIETAVFALAYAPAGLRPWASFGWGGAGAAGPPPPTHAALWALRLLLFRFMFSSGAVKLLSGDEAWSDLTALTYHYFTQPLPTRLGWFAHQLPLAFHRFACQGMFAVELGTSWLVFFGRWGRRVFAASTAALMLVIAATGNYGFFEPLTVVLCLPVLADDPTWPTFRQQFERFRRWKSGLVAGGRAATALAAALLAAFGLTLAAFQLSRSPVETPWLRRTQEWITETVEKSGVVLAAAEALEGWRAVNTYGLFAVMTKTRPSLEIQGSDDLAHWRSYEFRWKENDDLGRPPLLCEPHMPRLDWQMWFEALSNRPDAWFRRFLNRLLENEPAVLALLERNPFPDRPPRFVRAVRYDYEFTTPAERAETGQWWRRRETAIFQPPIGHR